MQKFDLIVIGTGTAASTTASECSSAGWSVAIIDSLPFGGTCALRGCDPKKVLVEAAKIIDSNQRHENKGIIGSQGVRIKWSDLIRFKRTFTDPFPKSREEGYINAGIVPFHGHARFIGPTTVKVERGDNNNNNTNDDIILNGKHILLATGSKPMNLNIPGEENIVTSDQFLELGCENLPDTIVFIGGGYISFEFAHIAARAGANVTILHRGKQPLEHFDPDLVNRLVQRSRDIGIDVKLEAAVKSIDESQSSSKTTTTSLNGDSRSKLVVYYSSPDSSKKDGSNRNIDEIALSRIDADMVIHGAGREPNIDGLDLKNAAGIDYTRRGIMVNEYLQSVSNPAVYAAGDVAANMGLPLTPVASYDGAIAANNLIKGNTIKTNYAGLPSVVFTIPSLVSVGMQEKEAKDQGLRFSIKHEDSSGWASSRRVGETCSAFKVLVEDDTNRILGAHILGPHAEEIINIFSIAIRLGLTTKELNDPILYTYPTNSSDILYML
jgi:glutathione reductase (NADPH)